ncbi:MAG: hypothetical protein CL910_11415 [Deltaproteobacteria bacterium]|jgi:hypothetical protein|nr:hypothetical protein [Deltaproteobacteria bacterium]
MTTLLVTLLAAALCHGAVVASLLLGSWAAVVPSIGLVCVVIVGRRSPPGRVRAVALAAGLVAGTLLEGGLLALPLVYIGLALIASTSRLVLPLESARSLLLVGCAFAILETLLVLAFGIRGAGVMLTGEAWAFATAGILLTGVAFALAEMIVDRAPRLRHALERP